MTRACKGLSSRCTGLTSLPSLPVIALIYIDRRDCYSFGQITLLILAYLLLSLNTGGRKVLVLQEIHRSALSCLPFTPSTREE